MTAREVRGSGLGSNPNESAAAGADTACVTTEPTAIQIEIERDGMTVRGRAAAPGRPTTEFSGWVGLMAAIDALLDESPSPSGGAPVPTSSPHHSR